MSLNLVVKKMEMISNVKPCKLFEKVQGLNMYSMPANDTFYAFNVDQHTAIKTISVKGGGRIFWFQLAFKLQQRNVELILCSVKVRSH